MKQIIDYQNEVLKEMVTNRALVQIDGEFYVAESIKPQEIRQTLISRFSEKLNDALQEPYSKAVLIKWSRH